jgi:hypothetical protein
MNIVSYLGSRKKIIPSLDCLMARLLRYNQRIVLYALSAYKPPDSFGWVTKVS